jgi:glycosyltransferase involved in cell wall biosynthesis
LEEFQEKWRKINIMVEQKSLKVIVPVLNESLNVSKVMDAFEDLTSKLNSKNFLCTLVVVDDGSTDNSFCLFLEYCKKMKGSYVLIKLRRNFGKDKAVQAALREVAGDYYVIVDADNQTPMSLIPEMVDQLVKTDSEMVSARKKNEPYGFARKYLTYLFFKVSKLLSIKEFRKGYSDFILFSRKVRDSVLELKEKEFVLRHLIFWFRYKEAVVEYIPPKGGKSEWSLTKLFAMALKSLVTFSNFLRINFFLSIIYWVSSLVYGGIIIYNKLTNKIVTGLSSTLLLILFSFGLLFFMIAIIGEILKIIFTEIKQRPEYLIEKVEGSGDKGR